MFRVVVFDDFRGIDREDGSLFGRGGWVLVNIVSWGVAARDLEVGRDAHGGVCV